MFERNKNSKLSTIRNEDYAEMSAHYHSKYYRELECLRLVAQWNCLLMSAKYEIEAFLIRENE